MRMTTVKKTPKNKNAAWLANNKKINRRRRDEGNWVRTTCYLRATEINIISLPIPSDATQEHCAQHRSVCPRARGMTKM